MLNCNALPVVVVTDSWSTVSTVNKDRLRKPLNDLKTWTCDLDPVHARLVLESVNQSLLAGLICLHESQRLSKVAPNPPEHSSEEDADCDALTSDLSQKPLNKLQQHIDSAKLNTDDT